MCLNLDDGQWSNIMVKEMCHHLDDGRWSNIMVKEMCLHLDDGRWSNIIVKEMCLHLDDGQWSNIMVKEMGRHLDDGRWANITVKEMGLHLEYDGEYEEEDHVHDPEYDDFRSLDTEHEEVDGDQPDPELDEEAAYRLADPGQASRLLLGHCCSSREGGRDRSVWALRVGEEGRARRREKGEVGGGGTKERGGEV